MDGDKADEAHLTPIESCCLKKHTRKRQMSSTCKEEEKEKLLGLPNVQKAFAVGTPSPEDSLNFILTTDKGVYDCDKEEQLDSDDIMNGDDVEADFLLFGSMSNQGYRFHESPEALFDDDDDDDDDYGGNHKGVRKVIIDNTPPSHRLPREPENSSSEEWECHKCNTRFAAVQMLWTHIDTCKNTTKPIGGLPLVPSVSHFATGRFDEDEEDLPHLEIPHYRKRKGRVYNAWEVQDEDEGDDIVEIDREGIVHGEYVPEGMTFEQQMEAALRASQDLHVNEDSDTQFEEDILMAIEMSVNETTPETMRLIELHREIDDMAIATAASLQTLSMNEFDCGWTKWETFFQKRDHPEFKVDAEPRHAMLWDTLRIMHSYGWLNTRCPKCCATRHGGSCIHFRPFDLSFLFKMRSVCFSWMCVIDSWMSRYKIRKVVFTCTRCRILGSKSKDTHLSQYYYTEKWEKTNIKLVNDYEMPNTEFECEFEGNH